MLRLQDSRPRPRGFAILSCCAPQSRYQDLQMLSDGVEATRQEPTNQGGPDVIAPGDVRAKGLPNVHGAMCQHNGPFPKFVRRPRCPRTCCRLRNDVCHCNSETICFPCSNPTVGNCPAALSWLQLNNLGVVWEGRSQQLAGVV